MADTGKKGGTLQFIALFLILYVLVQMVMGIFFPQKKEGEAMVSGPVLTATSNSFTLGNHPVLKIQNRPASAESHGLSGWVQSLFCKARNTLQGIPATTCAALAVTYTGIPYVLPSRCPQPSVALSRLEVRSGAEKFLPLSATGGVIHCPGDIRVEPGETTTVSLGPWKYTLFERLGTYEARLPDASVTASGSTLPARFSIVEPGVFTKIFRTFISAPFLNFLVLVASVTPGHNLGIAIILLTLAVKLLLFFPTQHSMEGQKKMQLLQPKLEELKKRFGDDPKKMQEETMKLWKEHGINPFQSCLPLVIQFPVLIGLFYVIRDGTDVALSQHLLYGPYEHLSWQFGTSFLGMNLLKPEIYVMPALLVIMQFLQMKLAFAIQRRKKRSEATKDAPAAPATQDMQQKLMLYVLPLMIGVFAFQFPSAVALYWAVSTLFGIGQQVLVNREHLRV